MSQYVRRYWPYVLILAAIAVVYHGWLAAGVITYGDWGYYASARMHDFLPIPTLWDGSSGTGSANILAGPMFPLLFLDGLFNQLGLGFAVSERVVWIFPGLILGALATYVLAVKLYANRLAGIVAALAVVFNSYVVVVMSGGQFTASTACLFIPLILWLFYRALERPTLPRLVLPALCVGVQVMYDLRSTYITVGVLILFSAYYLIAQASLAGAWRAGLRAVLVFAIIGVATLLMHLTWLLPSHYAERIGIALPADYNATFWVHVLSYMQLSYGLALFHPFWYQKTPVPHVAPVDLTFYLLPLLAFIIFLRRRTTFVDLFLFTLALLSIFLVKGSNAPAGNVYDWMFTHLPGFSLYRDPSKFYQPLALAYALLLGRTVTLLAVGRGTRVPSSAPSSPSSRSPGRLGRMLRGALPFVCFVPVLIPVIPVTATAPYGTLAPITVPPEYIALQHFMDRQPRFFRTLWVFDSSKYMGNSAQHPNLDAASIGQQIESSTRLPDPGGVSTWFFLPQAQAILRSLSVKYIVVGDNPDGRLAAPAHYAATQAQAVAMVHRAFPEFAETRFGHIYVFRNPSYLPAVFVAAAPVTKAVRHKLLQRAMASPLASVQRTGKLGEYSAACDSCVTDLTYTDSRYEVVVHHATHPFLLVLNQSFDPNWAAYVEPSSSTQPMWWTWTHPAISHADHVTINGFANAWIIDKPGTYRVVIEYWPQRLADIGFVLCWLTILACIAIAVGPSALRLLRRHASTVRRRVVSGIPISGKIRRERIVDRQGAR